VSRLAELPLAYMRLMMEWAFQVWPFTIVVGVGGLLAMAGRKGDKS
jgi:hypothetical protein